MNLSVTVACVWVRGRPFDRPDWVGRLYNMVYRNLVISFPNFKFVVISPHLFELKGMTRKMGIEERVKILRPKIFFPRGIHKAWYKLNLWHNKELIGPGKRILFLDLDTVILNKLTPLITYPGEFITAPTSGVPMRNHDFNTSVLVWDGDCLQSQIIRDHFTLKQIEKHRTDQEFLASVPMPVDVFPRRWVRKYESSKMVKPERPPSDTIVSLLIQGGKNRQLIEDGHEWIAKFWK